MEVKIQIPDNCELIKDGDTYIVREKKQEPPKSWEEFCKRYALHENEVYFNEDGNIISNIICVGKKRDTPNWIVNEQGADAILALIQLRQLCKAWVGDWEQPNSNNQIGFISYSINRCKLVVDYGCVWRNSVLSFPNREMAEDFLNCFRDLCETAKMLL